jgi:hypothetical protein
MLRAEERRKKIEKRREFIENLMKSNKKLFSPEKNSIVITEENYNSREDEDVQSLEKKNKVWNLKFEEGNVFFFSL